MRNIILLYSVIQGRKNKAKEIADHLARTVCLFTDQEHQEDDITSVICKVN